jgi:hypothetical protein
MITSPPFIPLWYQVRVGRADRSSRNRSCWEISTIRQERIKILLDLGPWRPGRPLVEVRLCDHRSGSTEMFRRTPQTGSACPHRGPEGLSSAGSGWPVPVGRSLLGPRVERERSPCSRKRERSLGLRLIIDAKPSGELHWQRRRERPLRGRPRRPAQRISTSAVRGRHE